MGVELDERCYIKVLEKFSRTYEFLMKRNIQKIEKLDSLWRRDSSWRKENLLLKIKCCKGDYIFKQIKEQKKKSELERVKLMGSEYPTLMPEVFVFENEAYLMRYIDGNSFFNLDKKEKTAKLNLAGKVLNETYSGRSFPETDISKAVQTSFDIYREKRKRFFNNEELRLDGKAFEIFKKVPNQPSHNDLNASNLLYGNGDGIKLIDPSEEGFNDISRDVGRYCASCFFNNYDYFGNDKQHSLEIAETFLSNFNEDLLERAKYFIGESFLSFLNFDTVSVNKSVLKKLSMNLLQKKGKIINLLEESLE